MASDIGSGRRNNDLNFSWVIEGKLAGCRVPVTVGEVQFLKDQGIDMLIRLVEPHVAGIARSVLESYGVWEHLEPVKDFTAPSQGQILAVLDLIGRGIGARSRMAVACGAGRGRTGTILACVFVMQGYNAKEAIAEVRSIRPFSVESGEQEEAVENFRSLVGSGDGLVSKLLETWPSNLLQER